MRPRRRDIVTRTATILTDLTGKFPDAWRRHQDARPALPGATSTDRDGGSTGPSDPTSGLALTGAQSAHDQETARIDQALRDLDRAVQVLDRFVASNTATTATAMQRRAAERENAAEPVCEHCTRHRPPGRVELVHRSGDVSGNLPSPMGLCRWCYDTVRRTGRLPSRMDIARHTRDLKPIRVYE